jgi:hypothetical protein
MPYMEDSDRMVLYIPPPYMSALYVNALYVCLICMPYMYALYVCLVDYVPLLKANALYVCLICKCLICRPYMYAALSTGFVCLLCLICACLICLICECLICACLICRPYMYAALSRWTTSRSMKSCLCPSAPPKATCLASIKRDPSGIMRQVSFVSIVGLFCLYSRSLLPL